MVMAVTGMATPDTVTADMAMVTVDMVMVTADTAMVTADMAMVTADMAMVTADTATIMADTAMVTADTVMVTVDMAMVTDTEVVHTVVTKNLETAAMDQKMPRMNNSSQKMKIKNEIEPSTRSFF